MPLTLDHIVIAVHDLETTIRDYSALGFNVQRGGDHPGRVTHNALIAFADGSYFELIAWKAPAYDERWWQLLERHGEGIVDFALLPASTAQTVREAAARGLDLEGPLDGGRVRPDGERLAWQTARARSHDLPFLCGDITPRRLRVPHGAATVHPNGSTGVASLAIAVHDLETSLARYHALLGDDARHAVGRPVPLAGSGSRFAQIALGETTLVLSASRDAVRAPLGSLAQQLATSGEGPYGVVLKTTDAAQPSGALDRATAHGALLEFELIDAPSRAVHSVLEAGADSISRSIGG